MRLAINTGGGDAPGLNAVIRAAVLAARARGWEVFGIRKGYSGLFSAGYGGVVVLDEPAVRRITHEGGTILGTTNRGSPFSFPVTQPDGSIEMVDRSEEVLARFREMGIGCLIAIGGDGSLRIARDLARRGLNVIGVPKTIDNDLDATVMTFGFLTAVQTATDAIDKLHSTTEAHERIMVVELMGRHAGWIALFAGLASTADVILIPEIPYRLASVVKAIEARWASGHRYAIVVVAEGARPVGGEASYLGAEAGLKRRLGGAAKLLSRQLRELTSHETRSLVLGHLQRGGAPTSYDRLISLRFGAAAVELAAQGKFGCMVALEPPYVKAVPLDDAVKRIKTVPTEGDIVRTGRALGISFGD